MTPRAPRPPSAAAWFVLAIGGLLLAARAVPPDVLTDAGVTLEWRLFFPVAGATLVWAFLADAGRRAGVKGWTWALVALALPSTFYALAAAGIMNMGDLGRVGAWALAGVTQTAWFTGASLAILVAARAMDAHTRGLVPWLVALPVLAGVLNPVLFMLMQTEASPAGNVYGSAAAVVPPVLALGILLGVHARAGTPRPVLALAGALAGALAVAAGARAAVLAAVTRIGSASVAEWNLAFSLTHWGLVLAYAGIALAAVAVTVPPRATRTRENAPSATTQRL